MRYLALLLPLLLVTAPTLGKDSAAEQDLPPVIAIIIDDMGHNLIEGERLIRMDQPLTLAFLPFRRHTVPLARYAHRKDKEIMLHAPMANTRNFNLGPGALEPDMNRQQIISSLRRSLQSVPHVQGVNNHMGSLLTQMREPMGWVMEELYRYPLYFVDSRTIASSVAADTASEHAVPALTRDVFLDHEQTPEYVDQQFRELIRKARQNGTAIGIGHPHKVTVDYLEKHLPLLDEQGIAIATVSGIWAMRNRNQEMFAEGEKQPVSPLVARSKED